MAVTAFWAGQALLMAVNKELDLDTDVIKCALFTDAHAPDQDVDKYYDAAHGMTEVANAGNYTTGGATMTTVSVGYTAGTNVIKIDADDTQWAAATFTAMYAMIYDSSPANNKPIIGWVNFGANQSPANQTFLITWPAAGIATITVAA